MNIWNDIIIPVDKMVLGPFACITGAVFAVCVLMENCFGVRIPLLPKFIDPRHITKSEV